MYEIRIQHRVIEIEREREGRSGQELEREHEQQAGIGPGVPGPHRMLHPSKPAGQDRLPGTSAWGSGKTSLIEYFQTSTKSGPLPVTASGLYPTRRMRRSAHACRRLF